MALMFGYKNVNGIIFPIRWDSDMPQEINKTYLQPVRIEGKDIRLTLKGLQSKYPYKPENEGKPKPS